LLESIARKINAYQCSLGRDGSGSQWQDAWMKMGWSLFTKGSLASRSSIDLMLSALNAYSLTRVADSISRLEQREEHREDLINSQLDDILTLLTNLPRRIGYAWEGAGFTPDNLPLKMVDPLGRKILLPMELCRTWHDLRSIITLSFQSLPGLSYIQRGEFDIRVSESSDPDTALHPWGYKATPGCMLTLRIVLRRRSSEHDPHRCPRCGTINEYLPCQRSVCRFCNCDYQTSPIIVKQFGRLSVLYLQDHQTKVNTLAKEAYDPQRTFGARQDASIEEIKQEISLFRNLHVIMMRDANVDGPFRTALDELSVPPGLATPRTFQTIAKQLELTPDLIRMWLRGRTAATCRALCAHNKVTSSAQDIAKNTNYTIKYTCL